jgi:CBS-domain-containing membrane protein
MQSNRESLKPVEGARRPKRRRLSLRDEFLLALLPTLTVLLVLGLVEMLSRQRLLFASLAASAFLIYLDPEHGTNTIRTLIIAQMLAAVIGLILYLVLGPGYIAGGSAMVITITLMILLDAVHPPAVATSLIFAFRAGDESNLILFGLAVIVTAALVGLEQMALWMPARTNHDGS